MKRLLQALVPLSLAWSACAGAAPSSSALDHATREHVVQRLIQEMKQRYVFPEVALKLETSLQQQLKAKAFDGVTDSKAFADRLTEVVQTVTKDKHARVGYSPFPLPERTPGQAPSAREREDMRQRERQRNYGVERVERLPGNIGYLDLRGFSPAGMAGETLAAAMTLLANTDALIFDLRHNGGGDPATVALLTSYLFDERTHLNSLYWREGDRTDQFWTHDWVPGQRFGQKKPVYVLTSSRTFSGAEEFSYNLKNLKRATLVGETTGGGANPGDVVRLTPHFGMFVPTGRAISPITGTDWEGVGVEPHVKTQAAAALDTAQLMALKPLAEAEQDPHRKAALQARIAELEKALSAAR